MEVVNLETCRRSERPVSPSALDRSMDRPVIALRPAGREDDLLGIAAQQTRHTLPGDLHGLPAPVAIINHQHSINRLCQGAEEDRPRTLINESEARGGSHSWDTLRGIQAQDMVCMFLLALCQDPGRRVPMTCCVRKRRDLLPHSCLQNVPE